MGFYAYTTDTFPTEPYPPATFYILLMDVLLVKMMRLCIHCFSVQSHTQDSGATRVKQLADPRWGRVIVLLRHWETWVTRHNVLVILYLKTLICHQTWLMIIKAKLSPVSRCKDTGLSVWSSTQDFMHQKPMIFRLEFNLYNSDIVFKWICLKGHHLSCLQAPDRSPNSFQSKQEAQCL